jgi:hypothetical protein
MAIRNVILTQLYRHDRKVHVAVRWSQQRCQFILLFWDWEGKGMPKIYKDWSKTCSDCGTNIWVSCRWWLTLFFFLQVWNTSKVKKAQGLCEGKSMTRTLPFLVRLYMYSTTMYCYSSMSSKGASDFSKKYLKFSDKFSRRRSQTFVNRQNHWKCTSACQRINFDNFCEIIQISDGFSRYLETYYGHIRW